MYKNCANLSVVCINNWLQNYNFYEIYARLFCENNIFAVKKINFSRKICVLLSFLSRIMVFWGCQDCVKTASRESDKYATS